MRKLGLLFFTVLIISGCANYQYQHVLKANDKGYFVSRDGFVIPEYTIGKDSKAPLELDAARERFKRRRHSVEKYYAQMGLLQSRLKDYWNFPVMIGKTFAGVFRLPFVATQEYKYNHNPEYRKQVDAKEEQEDALEEARQRKLRDELSLYVKNDLVLEPESTVPAETEVQKSVLPQAQEEQATKAQAKEKKVRPNKLAKKRAAIVKKEKKKAEAVIEGLKAVIIAKPVKGYSPLTVKFSGSKSLSPGARIVSYSWDFGDEDSSRKPNPINTFYSGSVEARTFTVTLTVKDNQGRQASVETTIEVLNK